MLPAVPRSSRQADWSGASAMCTRLLSTLPRQAATTRRAGACSWVSTPERRDSRTFYADWNRRSHHPPKSGQQRPVDRVRIITDAALPAGQPGAAMMPKPQRRNSIERVGLACLRLVRTVAIEVRAGLLARPDDGDVAGTARVGVLERLHDQ